MAPTRQEANMAFDVAISRYSGTYPKAMECLEKDKDKMLVFYDFPAVVHWQHIRTSNPIESTFATVRFRTAKTKGCVARHTILSMVYNLAKALRKNGADREGSNCLLK